MIMAVIMITITIVIIIIITSITHIILTIAPPKAHLTTHTGRVDMGGVN